VCFITTSMAKPNPNLILLELSSLSLRNAYGLP